jgi:hypothetical protein
MVSIPSSYSHPLAALVENNLFRLQISEVPFAGSGVEFGGNADAPCGS